MKDFKKLLALIMVIALAFTFCACGSTDGTAEDKEEGGSATDGMPNPMTECESLDEINEAAGSYLVHPGVMGVTDEKFFTIDTSSACIADYRFSVNGNEFVFRAAKTDDPINGLHLSDGLAFEGMAAPEYGVVEYVYDGAYKAARWFDGPIQYSLTIENEDMENATFEGIADELMVCTLDAAYTDYSDVYGQLAGDYADSTSQRASMTATEGEEGLDIVISWASSAFECTEWHLTAIVTEDGRLDYDDCRKLEYTYDADGNEEETEVYNSGTGYFEVSNGVIAWVGAEEENCRTCTFEPCE